MSDNSQNHISH